jgi:hypothetical protein
MGSRRILREIALTIFVFGLLVWCYVVLVQLVHPKWLPLTFAHYPLAPFNLRVDDVGVISFAFSALGFLVWRLLKE